MKRNVRHFQSSRLRIVGSFVGANEGQVDMTPPSTISEEEWLQTSFFGDAHHVESVPDSLKLRQITPDAALVWPARYCSCQIIDTHYDPLFLELSVIICRGHQYLTLQLGCIGGSAFRICFVCFRYVAFDH